MHTMKLMLVVAALSASLAAAFVPHRAGQEPREPTLHEAYYVTSGRLRILVPGNWSWRETAAGNADPRATVRSITIDPGGHGLLRLAQYTTDEPAEDRLDAAITRYLEGNEELARAPYGRWGAVEGVGAVVRFEAPDGTTHRLRVVVDRDDDGRVVEAHLLATDDASGTLDKGFMFIERTLEITDPAGG
ncbi:MAG: hypothetical protein RIB60_06380 [Phycisphaerales bacterium]